MTNNANEVITIVVADHANGGIQRTVEIPKGTAAEVILKEAGVEVKEGQRINFKGNEVEPGFEVTERGLVSVTQNTKAA